MKVTLRDLFWLTLLVAVLCGAWVRDRSQQSKFQIDMQKKQKACLLNIAALTAQINRLTTEKFNLEQAAQKKERDSE
ncbi:hypothetical protein NA78x_003472 [Anatilimnocola sp. NA78]|uniref:hypothetical protein n=1 Tax=Anatilimnocola sp. NA78 TaxID=3415683 RepID=UPI003CE55246